MPTTTGTATDLITFSRGSLATVTDSDGYIKWAPHNLLLASEQFNASAWGVTQVTVAANAIAAPNGTTTADLIKPTATTQPHVVYSNTVSGAALTYGAFVKANGYTKVGLRESTTSGTGAAFDLSGSGSVIGVYDAGSSTASNASISALANGWFYISCTVTFAAATFQSLGVCVLSPSYASGGNLYASWAANGTDSIYAWGAHLYRSDLGGMQANASAYPYYNPSTPKNLLGHSEAFNNAAWTKTNTTVTANATIAPNGTTTADELFTTAATAAFIISQNNTIGAASTALIYAKASGTGFFQLSYNGDTTSYANFNLSTGVLGTSTGTVTHSIESVGSGWFELAVVNTSTAVTGIRWAIVPSAAASRAQTFAGTGAESVYIWGAQISDSASLDPYVGSYGAAPSAAAAYGPRLDYDPSTLAAKGLLVEDQRTNLLLNSATLSTQSVTVTATAHTLSFYGTGTITLSGASSAGPLIGTGVYPNRVTLTFTPTAGTLTLTVTGNVSNAQLEAGAFATSYIPTAAATVTRNADVAFVATSQFPYGTTEGSIVANVTPINVSAARRAVQIDDGTENERYTLSTNSTPNGLFTVIDSGSPQAAIATGTPANNTNIKLAARYKVNDFALSVNGGAVSTDTTGTLPTANLLMRLGSGVSSVELINGHISQITYIPRALTNAELIARSA